MSAKRTVEQWRRHVYRSPHVSDAVKVLLLAMSEHMKENRQVSVPRETLAKELGRHPQRITERIKAACDARLLDSVSPGYRGHTAVYQGLFVEEARRGKVTDPQLAIELARSVSYQRGKLTGRGVNHYYSETPTEPESQDEAATRTSTGNDFDALGLPPRDDLAELIHQMSDQFIMPGEETGS